jgi:hypothetical protein
MTETDEHAVHHTVGEHEHGPDCGHESIQHGDHVDYIHDGHRHALHDDHYDEHHDER